MEIRTGNVFTFIYYKGLLEKWKLERLRSKKLTVKRKVYNPMMKRYEEVEHHLMLEDKEKGAFFLLTGYLPFIGIEYPKNHLSLIDKDLLYKDKLWEMLRDYQKQAVEEILKEPRGIFEGVTGSGKTLLMVAISKAIKPENHILVIIPKSQALLEQTVKVFLKFFHPKEIGVNYGKGFKHGRIMITSPGCADKLSLNIYKAVLVDECHSVPAKTIANTLAHMENAVIRYGFSGTPFGRSDEKDFLTIGLLGKPFDFKVTYKDLEEKGYIAKCKCILIDFNSFDLLDANLVSQIYDIKLQDLQNGKFIGKYSLASEQISDWHKIIELFVLKNKTRNYLMIQLLDLILNKLNRNCLVVVERIAHGELLSKLLQEKFSHIKFAFISSKTNNITQILDNFRNGKLQLIIATQLIEFGIDLPNLNTIILASIGKSSIQLLQRIGRGLRPKPNEILYIFDFCDRSNSVLKYHAYLRKKWLSTKGFEIEQIKINTLDDLRNLHERIIL